MPRAIYDPPATPLLLSAEGDFSDDVAFRHYLAQHAASQTLSLQRTEWYARSIRTMMIFFTALAVIGIIAGVIIGIMAAVDLHTLTQPVDTGITGNPLGG